MSGAFSFNELIKLIILNQPYIKYMPKGAPFMGARFQIEKLNRIANAENRKRPGTPINKRDTHIVMLFFVN